MIERTERDGVLTLRLAHGKVSALDLELVEAIALAVAEAEASDVKAVILTGSGSSFSAGVDLYRLLDGGRAYAEQFVPALARMLLDLFAMSKPLVIAANGHAVAGGCIMTLIGDYRLMVGGNARIGIPELLVGLPFPPSVIEIVRFVLPPQHLQMLLYTGRTVTADDALRLGMIDEIVDDGDAATLPARAEEIAREFAALPAEAFSLAKRQLRDKSISRAKHYAAETDVVDMWSAPAAHAHIREYLARTVRKKGS